MSTLNSEWRNGDLHLLLNKDVTAELSTVNAQSMVLFHYHDFFEMELVVEGEGYQFFDGKKFSLKKGDVFLCTTMDSHEIWGNLKLRHLQVRESALSDALLLKAYSLPNPLVLSLPENKAKRMDTMLQLIEEEGQDEKSNLFVINDLTDAVLQIFFETAPQSLPNGVYQKVCFYVQQNLSHLSDVSLDSIASFLGYSKCYTSRLFHEEAHMPLQTYLGHVRASLACRYLLQTELTINEICSACGYSSLSTFFSMFRRYVGGTPLEYRQNHQPKID